MYTTIVINEKYSALDDWYSYTEAQVLKICKWLFSINVSDVLKDDSLTKPLYTYFNKYSVYCTVTSAGMMGKNI